MKRLPLIHGVAPLSETITTPPTCHSGEMASQTRGDYICADVPGGPVLVAGTGPGYTLSGLCRNNFAKYT